MLLLSFRILKWFVDFLEINWVRLRARRILDACSCCSIKSSGVCRVHPGDWTLMTWCCVQRWPALDVFSHVLTREAATNELIELRTLLYNPWKPLTLRNRNRLLLVYAPNRACVIVSVAVFMLWRRKRYAIAQKGNTISSYLPQIWPSRMFHLITENIAVLYRMYNVKRNPPIVAILLCDG